MFNSTVFSRRDAIHIGSIMFVTLLANVATAVGIPALMAVAVFGLYHNVLAAAAVGLVSGVISYNVLVSEYSDFNVTGVMRRWGVSYRSVVTRPIQAMLVLTLVSSWEDALTTTDAYPKAREIVSPLDSSIRAAVNVFNNGGSVDDVMGFLSSNDPAGWSVDVKDFQENRSQYALASLALHIFVSSFSTGLAGFVGHRLTVNTVVFVLVSGYAGVVAALSGSTAGMVLAGTAAAACVLLYAFVVVYRHIILGGARWDFLGEATFQAVVLEDVVAHADEPILCGMSAEEIQPGFTKLFSR